jgi:hypothetical protein
VLSRSPRRRLASVTWKTARPPRTLRDPLVPSDELGESPLWPSAAILTAAALYATLPDKFIIGPSSGVFAVARWVVPSLTILLLVALLVSVPHGRVMQALGWSSRRLHVGRRVLSLTTIAIVTAANGLSIALLVHVLVNGAHVVASPLLRAAVHMWSVNVLVFALWFWQLDAGGPVARRTCATEARDFLFPQQADPELFPSAWQPTFIDYLYVSFTNAAAFSPTDTMPLSRWAKMLMLLQSAVSLTLAVMVVARAVNILR